MFEHLKLAQLKKRQGVITTVDIRPNTPICEFTGNLYTTDTLCELSAEDQNISTQIGPNVYLSPSGTITDQINHSCNPNCMVHAVGRRAILYSLYFIRANTEITFDYSTTSNEDHSTWKMECNCGSFNCRKEISGFQLLDPKLQEEYKQKGVAALFIRIPIFNRK